MKVAVCVISKDEQDYIVEYLEYYKNIGFDNVIFCDNNDSGNDTQMNILKPYIESGFVLYEDYRGQIRMQNLSYERSYKKYNTVFDWIAFFDMDEYLEITAPDCKTIQDALSLPCYASGCDCIHTQWKMHRDGGHIYKTEGTVFERFGDSFFENKHIILKVWSDVSQTKR